MKRVLIAEDETAIREFEVINLERSGYEVVATDSGEKALEMFEHYNGDFDLAVLDIMLPGIDGIKVCKELRKRSSTLGIILLTAKTQEIDKVSGLMLGADDYITKPFGIMEFISRVKAVLRRTNSSGDGVLALGQIQMDDQKRQVWSESSLCELTYKEYELLKFFLQNPGIVLSREKLINRVWGIDYEGESRTVDMHVKTLRQKLGSQGALIKTIRNVGYKIEV